MAHAQPTMSSKGVCSFSSAGVFLKDGVGSPAAQLERSDRSLAAGMDTASLLSMPSSTARVSSTTSDSTLRRAMCPRKAAWMRTAALRLLAATLGLRCGDRAALVPWVLTTLLSTALL